MVSVTAYFGVLIVIQLGVKMDEDNFEDILASNTAAELYFTF